METLILERLVIVFLLTILYGLQRQKAHKPVGFGTFTLVSAGSCALALTAINLGLENSIALLSAIVTGIGFLGAGALIRGNDKIFGFTTAASIWLFAIFGLVVGLGEYKIGLTLYLFVWIVVFVDNYLETKGIGSYKKKLTITADRLVDKKLVINLLAKHCRSFKLIDVKIDKKESKVSFEYLIEGLKKDISFLLNDFYKKKWCIGLDLE